LVNLSGQLIGIPTLSATNSETSSSANGIGYAISSDRAAYVANQLIQHGKLSSTNQGFLGIEGQDVTPQVAGADGLSAQSGVLVSGFANDAAGQSPAQQAGLQTGDVITAVNGQAITGSDDLSSATMDRTPGTTVTLSVTRGSTQLNMTLILGERPVK
jgi:S1-C subfamily serine protease